MATDLTTFLLPVVDASTRILQLNDADTNSYANADPVVGICANLAYSQIISYLNRPLLYGRYTELYGCTTYYFKLRTLPIDSIVSVTIDGTAAVADTDYTVVHTNNICITQTDALGNETTDSSLTYDVVVEYDAGYTSVSNDIQIQSALILQTVANFHRKSTFGVASVKAESSSSITAFPGGDIDAGSIIESARNILDRYQYYGEAEELGYV